MKAVRRIVRPHHQHRRRRPWTSIPYIMPRSPWTAPWCWWARPPEAHKSPSVFALLMARRSIAGSGIGGIPETQEMLDFCAEKGVASDIEIIPKIQDIEKGLRDAC